MIEKMQEIKNRFENTAFKYSVSVSSQKNVGWGGLIKKYCLKKLKCS